MRRLITTGLVGALLGCAKPTPPGAAGGSGDIGGIGAVRRCPDSTCTESNGTGVYFAEEGAAGIGPMHLMITHFINGTSRVDFQGRYFDIASNLWRPLSEVGTVYRADLPSQSGLSVVSVSETDTVPIWKLQAGNQPPFLACDAALIKHRAIPPVCTAPLRDLKLYIIFGVPILGQTQYVLEFADPDNRSDPTPRQATKYPMRWHALNGSPSPTVYCTDAKGNPDPVVFQRGIDVEPVYGTVTANSNLVTLSCDLGAPATVYRWGYDYNNIDLFYFSSGIQMKRASYCADSQYYTVAGTAIDIADDHSGGVRSDHLEAWWTPSGASCANPDNARHPEIVKRKQFTWQCGAGPLPPCQAPPGNPPVAKYLVDSPAQPNP